MTDPSPEAKIIDVDILPEPDEIDEGEIDPTDIYEEGGNP